MEKRRYKRKQYSTSVDYVASTKLYHGEIGDISCGGMLMNPQEELEPGVWLTMYFNTPGNISSVRGKVVRAGDDGVGIEFLPGYEEVLAPLVDRFYWQ